MTSRRSFFLSAVAGGACARGRAEVRLRARPAGTQAPGAGLRGLGVRRNRDAQLYVPAPVAESGKPSPFLVYLHGAGGSAQQGIKRLSEFADALGFVLLSPASEGRTWDAIGDVYGPDVRALDDALGKAFTICRVDATRVGVCGFSDGASYALGVGLANGELFKAVMAFSPGFIPQPVQPSGSPRVFVSHGTRDQILPIETCSRRMVPELKQGG